MNVNYQEYLKSEAWQDKREAMLSHWNNQCALCSSPNNLHVHHRTYKRLGYENETDLIVLCDRCHERHHTVLGRDEGMITIGEIGKRLKFDIAEGIAKR